MNNPIDFAQQAEIALAAYANLNPSMSESQYLDALRDSGRGMAAAQALGQNQWGKKGPGSN